MQKSSRKFLLLLLGVLLLGVLLYRSRALLHLSDFSGAKLLHAVSGANPLYLILSVVTIYVCYALRALRWQRFQRHVGPAHFGEIYRMTLAGFSAVFLLGRAGEPVRPVLLARKGKIPLADTFGIWALERLFDVASMAVIAAIALLIFRSSAETGDAASAVQRAARTAGATLALGVAVASAALIYLRVHGTSVAERRLGTWLAARGWRAATAKIILGFIRGIQTVRSWSDLLVALFYSTVHWFLVLVVYFLVTRSFAGRFGELTFSDCMLLLAFTLIGSAVQLPTVGGGSQALAIFAYTRVFGIEREPAVAAAIVLWLVSFAACSLVGVPLLLQEGLSLGKLRQFAKREKEELDEAAAAGQSDGGHAGGSPE
jgi:uncharacterized protein (TIRG00374 family)